MAKITRVEQFTRKGEKGLDRDPEEFERTRTLTLHERREEARRRGAIQTIKTETQHD